MQLERDDSQPITLEIKRLYLPYIIKDECPKCGETVAATDYISYPVLGQIETISFYHYNEVSGDEHEWQREIIVDLTVRIPE